MTPIAFDDDYSRAYLDEKQELCHLIISDYRELMG